MIEDIISAIDSFVEERDWDQYHNPKDLAISISLEASELLELFQWRTSEESVEEYPEKLKEELADIMIYCLQFASSMGYDVEDIILSKLAKNAVKYPVSKAKGKKDKYTAYTQEAGSDEK
ncbi:MAG: nucleotide pyrophosphohydrolase [Bullifex sp.]